MFEKIEEEFEITFTQEEKTQYLDFVNSTYSNYLKQSINDINNQIENALDLWSNGDLMDEQLDAQIADLNVDLGNYNEQLRKIDN